MNQFPLFLNTTGCPVLVIGGGEDAAQRVRLLRKCDAQITVVADVLDLELEALVEEGAIARGSNHQMDARIVVISKGVENPERLATEARGAGALVFVSGRRDLSDFSFPTIVDRDPVLVAIGTGGQAPTLARRLKADLEVMLDPALGRFAKMAGGLRKAVADRMERSQQHAFWRWAYDGAPWQSFRKGAERDAMRQLKAAASDGLAPSAGHIALVGAGPGARDLLTVRAINRLQEADVIFYDRLVDPEVLDYARPDAKRVYVGKVVGACAWPQEKICEVISAEARKGLRVVRLKSGDPGIFGRATEELDAARANGIAVEIVPGVTAAMGAAAAAGRSLTERGVSDTLVLATGMLRPGAAAPDWARHAHPGTATAFYMSVGQSAQIVDSLLAVGMPAQCPVTVGVEVSKPGQALFDTTLADLPAALAKHGVTGCATILTTWPKDMPAEGRVPVPQIA
jgi:uroporphyrin-III C-methyltransferase/precorrin-2 dehydrogenase/sirohydrochlorin ferrochelatase